VCYPIPSSCIFLLLFVCCSCCAGLQMYAVLAFFPVGTKPSKVEPTEFPPHKAIRPPRAFLSEAFIVVFAHGQFRTFLDMHVKALVALLTISILVVELALAHLSQIVLMQVITSISFLTKPLEPVFAHVVVVLVVAAKVVVLVC